MQRHGESHIGFFRELIDLRHEAGGRQRHPAPRQIESVVIHENPHRRDHVPEVRQRLAMPMSTTLVTMRSPPAAIA